MSPLVATMVDIPAGSITLHDARSSRIRNVQLQEFTLARAPVTWSTYAHVLGVQVPDNEQGESPVHSVSWVDAAKWCNLLSRSSGLTPAYNLSADHAEWTCEAEGYRLPTEAEWEYACRAGSSGPQYGSLEEIAWTEFDDLERAQRIELKKPNDFGLFDTLGNVWEWCWDFLDPARYANYRVFRGGGWSDKHWNVRASVRRGSMPEVQLDDVGFRVARGAITPGDEASIQGWSPQADADRARASTVQSGWTPLKVWPAP